MIAASVMPTRARLAMIAPSESSQSGAVPNSAYKTVATSSRRLRPRRSRITPATGASSASASAGTVSASGTSALAPGVEAKCSCILGSTGAISTAPRTGRQLPAISAVTRSRCAGPDTLTGGGADSSIVVEGRGEEAGMATPWTRGSGHAAQAPTALGMLRRTSRRRQIRTAACGWHDYAAFMARRPPSAPSESRIRPSARWMGRRGLRRAGYGCCRSWFGARAAIALVTALSPQGPTS